MGVFGFVIALIAMSAGLMGARWLLPHFIDSVAVYASVFLCSLAFFATLVGLARK